MKQQQDVQKAFLIRGIFSGGVFSIIGNAATFGVKSVLSILMGPFGLGVYEIIISFSWIFSSIAQLGVNQSVVKFVPQLHNQNKTLEKTQILVIGLIAVAAMSLLLSLFIYLFRDSIGFALFKQDHSEIFIISICLILPLMATSQYLSFAFRALRKIAWDVMMNRAIYPIIFLVFIAVSNFYFEIEINGVIWATPIIYFIINIIGIVKIKQYIGRIVFLDWKVQAKTLFSHSFYAWVVSVTRILSLRSDKIVLALLLSPFEVGMYAFAYMFGSLISLFNNAITPVSQPLISDAFSLGDRDKLGKLYEDLVSFTLICMIPCFTFVVLFGETLIVSVFGSEFQSTYVPVLLILAAYLFNAIAGPSGNLLLMGNHEKLLAKIQFIGLIVSNGLLLILVPQFAVMGAALSLLISWTILETIKMVLIKRLFSISLLKKDILILVTKIGFIQLVAGCFATLFINNTYLQIAIFCASILLLYALLFRHSLKGISKLLRRSKLKSGE